LPTPARPIVDAGDVRVPEGYEVEAVLVRLTMPTGMKAAQDGTLFVLEGGASSRGQSGAPVAAHPRTLGEEDPPATKRPN
jgi:hypothetical protein